MKIRERRDLGHEVIVADPNYAAMYATRSRRVKTDRRDAEGTGQFSAGFEHRGVVSANDLVAAVEVA